MPAQDYGTSPKRVGSGGVSPKRRSSNMSNMTLPKSPFVHFGSNSFRIHAGAAKHLGSAGLPPAEAEPSLLGQCKTLIVGPEGEAPKYLNILLLAVIMSIPAVWWASEGTVFVFAFIGLIPLAAMLGDLTDDLANSLGNTLGAFLNITFGNATEVIICIAAIHENMFDVIKAGMLGSILGNMLLVLGTSFMAAGDKATFNRMGINIYSSLLLLSSFAFLVPTALAYVADSNGKLLYSTPEGEYIVLRVSRYSSIVLVTSYLVFVYYQTINKHHFEAAPKAEYNYTMEKSRLLGDEEGGEREEEEEEEEPQFTVTFAVVALATVTLLIAIQSELVVSALEPFAEASGISKPFIALVLLPIVGNVCEHASAIMMAMRNKMDIAIGVAVGSSIQIGSFVIPFLVLISWWVNGENPPPLATGPAALDLNFRPFCTVMLVVSVLVVNTVVNVERSTWITGLFLLHTYGIIAICCWFAPTGLQFV